MTDLVQDFHLGQRVQPKGELPFEVLFICLRGGRIEYSGAGRSWYSASLLTLAPEPPPCVPSERRVVPSKARVDIGTLEYINAMYRPETDAEMSDRHKRERGKRDAQEGAL